jgi:hypothetical protein
MLITGVTPRAVASSIEILCSAAKVIIRLLSQSVAIEPGLLGLLQELSNTHLSSPYVTSLNMR